MNYTKALILLPKSEFYDFKDDKFKRAFNSIVKSTLNKLQDIGVRCDAVLEHDLALSCPPVHSICKKFSALSLKDRESVLKYLSTDIYSTSVYSEYESEFYDTYKSMHKVTREVLDNPSVKYPELLLKRAKSATTDLVSAYNIVVQFQANKLNAYPALKPAENDAKILVLVDALSGVITCYFGGVIVGFDDVICTLGG